MWFESKIWVRTSGIRNKKAFAAFRCLWQELPFFLSHFPIKPEPYGSTALNPVKYRISLSLSLLSLNLIARSERDILSSVFNPSLVNHLCETTFKQIPLRQCEP